LCCQFQQVDVNSGLGYNNLTLSTVDFLPFNPDTLTTQALTGGQAFLALGQGLITFDPTFESFALLELVSYLVNWFFW
jgi:hypothetical protein